MEEWGWDEGAVQGAGCYGFEGGAGLWVLVSSLPSFVIDWENQTGGFLEWVVV